MTGTLTDAQTTLFHERLNRCDSELQLVCYPPEKYFETSPYSCFIVAKVVRGPSVLN